MARILRLPPLDYLSRVTPFSLPFSIVTNRDSSSGLGSAGVDGAASEVFLRLGIVDSRVDELVGVGPNK